MKFEYQEAFEESLKYFEGDELAANVVTTKYLLTDDSGNFLELNPDDMHRRIATELSRVENKYPNPESSFGLFGLRCQ